MKKINLLLTISIIITSFGLTAQVAINSDGSTPASSAMLDVQSINKGFLPPRMTTTQRNAISSPATGLLIFNTSTKLINFFNGTEWETFNDTWINCGVPITYSGQTINTVLIGDQCWMAENLNIGTMISASNNQTNNSTIEKYCYSDWENYCNTYGGIYQWDEMMQYVTTEGAKGICPTSWHLPTDDEWKTMEIHLGLTQAEADALGSRGTDQGSKLKETGTTHWMSPNTGATNSSGFTAFGGGYRTSNGATHNLTNFGVFWTTSEKFGYTTHVYYRRLAASSQQVYRSYQEKTEGNSVRCLKD